MLPLLNKDNGRNTITNWMEKIEGQLSQFNGDNGQNTFSVILREWTGYSFSWVWLMDRILSHLDGLLYQLSVENGRNTISVEWRILSQYGWIMDGILSWSNGETRQNTLSISRTKDNSQWVSSDVTNLSGFTTGWNGSIWN